MRILKSWLQDFVDIKISDQELENKLNISGTEVDEVIKSLDDRIVVGLIKSVDKHPNADRLQVATVFDGEKDLQIVCGAPNIAAGQKVPLATVGTQISGFEIKEAEIRGVKSFGMMCSEKELGLGDDHSGIKILDDSTEVGKKLNEIISGDTTLELEITTNRGDCLSHIGVAREIAALTDQKIENNIEKYSAKENSVLNISIEDKEGCYRYFGAYIKNVKIGDSPEWLKKRLIACGAKPISNIVDITNYIMLDLGQPLHAFDATKVDDLSIVVRRAGELEDIVTLDGEVRALSPNNVVIADSKKPVAIAGIMGGANSEISNETKDIILEAAQFDPAITRKSSKLLNLSTEASYRYERGIDGLGVEKAFCKAIKMIAEVAGGELVDIKSDTAKEYSAVELEIPHDKINALLGLSLSNEQIEKYLASLGFEIKHGKAVVPSWRHDIAIWQDLAEEVGRLYGYNNIEPLEIPATKLSLDSVYYKKEFIKDILISNEFVEVANYSFLSENDAKSAKQDTSNFVEVANPIQPENKYLRNSLIPGLLRSIAKNPSFDPVAVFEIGKTFSKDSEITSLGIAASGKNTKKLIDSLVNKLKEELKISQEINVVELSRDELQTYKIRKPVTYFAELNLDEILSSADFSSTDLTLKHSNKQIHYRPVSKFPSLTRDLAFIVDADTDADKVADAIYEVSALINRVELFDEFASDKFGQGKKNIAFHLYLQKMDSTLTDKEADTEIKKIVEVVEKKYEAKLRSN